MILGPMIQLLGLRIASLRMLAPPLPPVYIFKGTASLGQLHASGKRLLFKTLHSNSGRSCAAVQLCPCRVPGISQTSGRRRYAGMRSSRVPCRCLRACIW